MIQLSSVEVVLKNTAEAVLIPLKDGISSLNEVYQALIEADVDPITGKCSNYDHIRQQIVQAHQLLEQSEQAASSAMMIGGAIELDQANRAVQVAQDEARNSENEMRKYELKVSFYRSKISQTEHDISQKDDELNQTRKGIQIVKEQIEVVAKFQEKVRSAVNLLGVLSGRVSVTEHQTRRLILQEPVMKVLEDVMKAIEQITGNELLYSNDLPKLISQMTEKNQQLADICASENSSK
ncbi:hypothetical protein QTP86_012199 [Hemibagrus guttatus]|nr:hypothetical protein QTP86_012199 [Hemibagrus guttatus]